MGMERSTSAEMPSKSRFEKKALFIPIHRLTAQIQEHMLAKVKPNRTNTNWDPLGLRPRLWLVRTFGAFEQPPNPSTEGAKYDSLGRSPRRSKPLIPGWRSVFFMSQAFGSLRN